MAMTSMVSQALILIFLVEAHSGKFSALAIGIVLGASGVGGAVGSFCSRIPYCGLFGNAGYPSRWGHGLLYFSFSRRPGVTWLVWSAVAMFVMSVTGAIGNVECRTYLTENIADDMIGKVSGICSTMTIGACALGPIIGGYAVQSHSIKDAVSVLFAIVVIMALASLLVFKKSSRRGVFESESGPVSVECLLVGWRESPDPVPFPMPLSAKIIRVSRLVGGMLRSRAAANRFKKKIVDHSQRLTNSGLAAETSGFNANLGRSAVRSAPSGQTIEESGGFRKDWNPSPWQA